MKPAGRSPLLELLADPGRCRDFGEADWDLVIRQGRAAGLLGTLYHLLGHAALLDAVPERPLIQLRANHAIAERHRDLTYWEVCELHEVLDRIGVPVVILKGAAYVMAGLDAAKGRLFGDVDILVPRGALRDVERALARAGWVQESRNAYDDRYYRQWMHELPPRRHIQRGSVIDVHHNLLPLTARNKPDVRALWQDAVPLAGFEDLYVLSPADMILHSAAHLFLNGEFDRGLRDLYDFVRLAREYGSTPGFHATLEKRAETLDLRQPLRYATRYANLLLQAGLPEPGGDSGLRMAFLDAVFTRALQPAHPSAQDAWSAPALFFLYVRGHYLRMPLHLLLPHLLYKATLAKHQEVAKFNENQEAVERFREFLR